MRHPGRREPSRQAISAVTFTLLLLLGCGGPEEARRVELPVFADPSGTTDVTTDLGYQVVLHDARASIENLTFSLAGEIHTATLWDGLSELLLSRAHAHPGHFQGGEITGELRGRFVMDWISGGEEIGAATLLVGTYKSANFTFGFADAADGRSGDDPFIGHTAIFRGAASRSGETVEFQALIDSPVGRELVGAPFEFEVGKVSKERLGVRCLTKDSYLGGTLFDGIDFFDLPTGEDGIVEIGPASTGATQEAYNRLRRTFQTHDHFDVKANP